MTPRGSRALGTSEQRHRQWLLLALAGLLVLSTAPVFGHHVARPGGWWPLADHIGTLCFEALKLLFAPVHDGFHLVILVGVAYAVFDRTRAAHLQRRVLEGLDAHRPQRGTAVWHAAREARVAPVRLVVVTDLPNPAFTAGFLWPRIFIAGDLPAYLTHQQLVAVIAHERAHLRRRDPLRLFLLRALAATLFWLPALRRLADDLADEAEILADDTAAAQAGSLPLASAILAVAGRSGRHADLGVGFARADLLERRVRRLMGEAPPRGTHVTWRSVAAAAAVLAVVWSSGAVMLHARAIDAAAVTEHCEHNGTAPWTHLFCRRTVAAGTTPCPHSD